LIEENKKIEVLYNLNVKEIQGEKRVAQVVLDGEYKNTNILGLDGLFIEIGSDPNIDFTKDLGIEVDEDGYIKIKKDAATSQAGIWAAGDITDGSDKFFQVITAAAEGAIAARSISNFLRKQK
ncbi:MAG: FAD-dependent oxidoreductase, partial [Candidatus Shapirobacteria bacterium]|nr:FAD-dependent oxidoreductase [Candidatus Shapirobacteria bacterium]